MATNDPPRESIKMTRAEGDNVYLLRPAKHVPHLLLQPGEGHQRVPARPEGTWAMVFANSAIWSPTLNEIAEALESALDELRDILRAEHENGYHLRTPRLHCPFCAPQEMACPACDNVEGNRWHEAVSERESTVRCGARACQHVWAPFTVEV